MDERSKRYANWMIENAGGGNAANLVGKAV
jgi:hypothetical protein